MSTAPYPNKLKMGLHQATLQISKAKVFTWSGAITGIVFIVVCFVIFGIWGQLYLSNSDNSRDDQELFERNAVFWLGNKGILFSIVLLVFLVMGITTMVVIIRISAIWKTMMERRFIKLETHVIDAAVQVSTAAKSVTKLTNNIRTDLVPDLQKGLGSGIGSLVKQGVSGVRDIASTILSNAGENR